MIQQTKLKSYDKKLVYFQKNRYSIQNLEVSHNNDHHTMGDNYDKQIYMHGSQFNAQHLQNYLKYSKYSNMSNHMNSVMNQQDQSAVHTDLNGYKNDDQVTDKSFLQDSKMEFSKMEDINQINGHLSIKDDKQSKSKSNNNSSFFFKNKNYRDDIINESKFQIRDYDMNNMNSMNIIDHKQKDQIMKNQKALQKSGYYNKYYSQRETDFDQDKLNFSKDRSFNQKQEYQVNHY